MILQLQGFEMLTDIALTPEPWTPQSGLVTEAFKLKRNVVQEK